MSKDKDNKGMTSFTFRIERKKKEEFKKLCESKGLSMSTVILGFIREALENKGATIKDENGFTPEEVSDLEKRIKEAKAGHLEEHDLIED